MTDQSLNQTPIQGPTPVPTSAGGLGHGMAHVAALDGVRAASILLVLMAHTLPLGPAAWEFNGMAGRMGMALFFCLSGFLIVSMLWRDPDVPAFLAKRVMRIVPALALYLGVLVLFFGLPVNSFVLNLLFLSNYWTDGLLGGPVGHLWSLCVEMHFYLAIALAVAIGGRLAVWLVVPAALVVTGLRIDLGIVSNINTHLRADEILVGGWLALAAMHRGEALRRLLAPPRRAAVAILVLAGLFALSSHDRGGIVTAFRPYLAMALVGAVMHCRLRPLLAVLESAPARYVASISYALYIWHPLMIHGVMNSGSTLERYLVKRPASWALTWAAAHLSTRHWEAPWQRRVRGWLGRRG